MAIEKMDTRTSQMMCELLGSLHRAIIITPTQMRAGFVRVSVSQGWCLGLHGREEGGGGVKVKTIKVEVNSHTCSCHDEESNMKSQGDTSVIVMRLPTSWCCTVFSASLVLLKYLSSTQKHCVTFFWLTDLKLVRWVCICHEDWVLDFGRLVAVVSSGREACRLKRQDLVSCFTKMNLIEDSHVDFFQPVWWNLRGNCLCWAMRDSWSAEQTVTPHTYLLKLWYRLWRFVCKMRMSVVLAVSLYSHISHRCRLLWVIISTYVLPYYTLSWCH